MKRTAERQLRKDDPPQDEDKDDNETEEGGTFRKASAAVFFFFFFVDVVFYKVFKCLTTYMHGLNTANMLCLRLWRSAQSSEADEHW